MRTTYTVGKISIALACTVCLMITNASAQDLAFPFWADDLPAGVRLKTGDHAAGIQGLGKDIHAARHVGDDQWSLYVEGKDGSTKKNTDWVVYGIPFYAVAAGEVVGCWRNAPENPTVGSRHPEVGRRMIGGGNHLWIRHDDGNHTLYAHAIPGSIPANLCPKPNSLNRNVIPKRAKTVPDVHPIAFVPEGVAPDVATGSTVMVSGTSQLVQRPRVKKGEYLGKVGNSGASGNPHLHIHIVRGTGASGVSELMVFERGLATSISNSNKADINQWQSFSRKKVPDGRVLVWPARRLANEYARHKYSPDSYGRLFKHLTNSGFVPVWFDGYQVGGKVFYNFVWRPVENKTRAWSSLTKQQLQDNFDKGKADGYTPMHIESYRRGAGVRYAMIMQKGVSGAYLLKSGLTENQHKEWLETAKSQGLNPVNVSVISINDQRRYTVLYRSNSIGGWVLRSKIHGPNYQAFVEQQYAQGRGLRYVSAYNHDGKNYYSAIFATSYKNASARHGLTPSNYQNAWKNNVSAKRYTRVVTGIDNHPNKHRYAGVWKSD